MLTLLFISQKRMPGDVYVALSMFTPHGILHLTPDVAVKEHLANGAPTTDSRVAKLLPKEVLDNKILYPAEEMLTPLEFGAAATLTDPARAELMARFKSA